MKSNVGGIDRILRIVIGIALITLATMCIVGAWGWIGVVPLLTGLFGTCSAYMHARHEHLPDQTVMTFQYTTEEDKITMIRLLNKQMSGLSWTQIVSLMVVERCQTSL